MVGASLKSRSSVESCWFSDRTTPRSRGEDFKTQNGKNKSEHKHFGTAEFIAEAGVAGERKNKRAGRSVLRVKPPTLPLLRHPGAAAVHS